MYVGRDFHPSDVGENEVYTFDFENDLADGETIATATWICSVADDSEVEDADAQSHVSVVDPLNTDTKTSQRIAGLVDGVKYVLQAIVTTSDGNTKSLWSHVIAREPH